MPSHALAQKVLPLVEEAIAEATNPSAPLSSVVLRAIRIARLRGDYQNLWWLEMEMQAHTDKYAKRRIAAELRLHFTRDEWTRLNEFHLESFIAERAADYNDSDKITALGIGEVEAQIEAFERLLKTFEYPPAISSEDFIRWERQTSSAVADLVTGIRSNRGVLTRVRHRVHEFLTLTEQALLSGGSSNVFERNREYVDAQLAEVAPSLLDKFRSAYEREAEGTPEARVHAMTTCRRLMKAIADHLYPTPGGPVTGADGVERTLTEDQYINRLIQFIGDTVGRGRSGQLLLDQMDSLTRRIEAVYGLASKGVHADPSDMEAAQCVMETYTVVGILLRLRDNDAPLDEELATYSGGEGAS